MWWTKRLPTLFLIGFSILILVESVSLGIGESHRMGAGFLPFVAAFILLCLSLASFLMGLRGVPGKAGSTPSKILRNAVVPAIWVVAICGWGFALDSLGFVITTFLFMSVIFFTTQPDRKIQNLAIAAGIALVSYYLFHVLLGVLLPAGIFPRGW